MNHALRPTSTSFSAVALLAGLALASPPSDNGWCHLTPWTAETPAMYEDFGRAVALEGEWAAVTAAGEDSVRLFRRDGGTWSPVQTLMSPTPDQHGDSRFGERLVLDAGRLFISDSRSDAVAPNGGAVYRYECLGGAWQLAEMLTSASPGAEARFGRELDVDGPWLVALERTDGVDGHAEVLRHDGDQWLAHATLVHDASVTFGTDVAVRDTASGTYANVFVADSNAFGSQGAAFHFRVHPFGYQIGPTVKAPNPHAGDSYANDLAFDGEHLVVGAGFTKQQGISTGAALVFDVDGDVFPPVVGPGFTIWPEEPQANAAFGTAVAVDGGRLVIGARSDDLAGVQGVGSLSVYRPDAFGNGWHLEDRLFREGAEKGAFLGMDVSLDGDLVLAGSPGTSQGLPGSFVGEAVLFSLTSRTYGGGLAPSDVLATVEHYGAGKAGQLGVPDLHLSQPLVPGESSLMGVSQVAEGTAPFIFFGLDAASQAFDGGALLVANPHVLALPVVGPFEQVGWQWDVPADDLLAGFELFIQVLLVDPLGSGLKQTAQSRGMRVVIGY